MTEPQSKTFRAGPALAAEIQRRLESQGMSPEDWAFKSRRPLSVVMDILSGRSGSVKYGDLFALAIGLGTDVDEIMKAVSKDA
jgi:predicted transcriptional regulator